MRGIVWDGQALEAVRDLEVRDPAAGEVAVRIAHSGLCHSDISVVNGSIPFPTPAVLGHEGSGVVEALGSGVTGISVGDHVVLSTLGNCGLCAECDSGRPTMCRQTFGQRPKPFARGGVDHFAFANVSSFAERTVVRVGQAVPIPKEIPLAAASLIGCGVLTGAGAVLNRARVSAGRSAVVLGVGGIGLNALQALHLIGAHPIIAVDTNPKKAKLALQFGATHFVDASETEVSAKVTAITHGGADFVFECVGSKKVIEGALELLDWAGTLVILGVTPFGTKIEFTPESIYLDKTIMGCRYGSSRPQQDIRRYAELYLAGRWKLDELITRQYPLEDFRRAFEDMEAGQLARGVLDVNPS